MNNRTYELTILIGREPEIIEIIVHPLSCIEEAVIDLEEDYQDISVLDYEYQRLEYYPPSDFKRKSYAYISDTKLSVPKEIKLSASKVAA